MIELAKSNKEIVYCILEYPYELDKLNIGYFTYFKNHLGMHDYIRNFKSWINRQNVVLISVVFKNTVVGWAMAEKWSSTSNDGKMIYVIRGIEVSSSKKGNGFGKVLLDILSMILPGHIITKPVNKKAKNFFFSLNFRLPSGNSPVNLGNHPGYLILFDGDKGKLCSENVDFFMDSILSYRNRFYSRLLAGNTKGLQKNSGYADKNVNITIGCSSKETVKSSFSIKSQPRDYVTYHKLMSPCMCGEFSAKKCNCSDGRDGISIICSNCGRERYYLPRFSGEIDD